MTSKEGRMEEKKYCGDCDWYIPGGKEPNCANPTKLGNGRYTCPIREACKAFVPKTDCQVQEEESDITQRNKCRRVKKAKKRHK